MSGRVRTAFRDKGHDAWSCDILPAEDGSKYHIQGDVLNYLNCGWDLMVAHPPCTFLCNSGVCWLSKRDEFGLLTKSSKDRWFELIKAKQFFRCLINCNIPKICVENPIPHKYGKLPKYSQIIQPWQFGEDASKATCLWLKNLPKLTPTNIIKKKRYGNQTPSGRCNLPPGPDRAKIRSLTYVGIAKAMADQWG